MVQTFLVETTDTAGELRLIGELDLAGAETLSRAIADVADSAPVTLDLEQLQFMDSSGLRELLKAARERTVRLVSPSQAVHKVLEIAGVLSAFEVLNPPDVAC